MWQLADCKNTETKLILSDHPVTVYNKGCFPQSTMAKRLGDPEIWMELIHIFLYQKKGY